MTYSQVMPHYYSMGMQVSSPLGMGSAFVTFEYTSPQPPFAGANDLISLVSLSLPPSILSLV